MRLRDNISDFFEDPARYVRIVEYALGIATIAWGVRLAWPPAVFPASASWTALRESPVPEIVWGAVIALLGLIKIIAAARRWRITRLVVAFLGLLLWSAIAGSFAYFNSASPGWTAYILYAVLNLLTFLRMSQRGVR